MAKIVNGEKRGRPGRWIVDYRDASGRRRWVTCRTRKQAKYLLEEKLRDSRQPPLAAAALDLTVAAYSERWMEIIETTVKPRTQQGYQKILRLHILPALGRVKIRQLHKGHIRLLLAEKLRGPLKRNSVRLIHATI